MACSFAFACSRATKKMIAFLGRSYLGSEGRAKRARDGFRSLDVRLLRLYAADSGLVALLLWFTSEGEGEVSGNARTGDRRLVGTLSDRGGALFVGGDLGWATTKTTTYPDDDEGATELIERETHLADVFTRPNVRGATRCVPRVEA
jgi:hypothetical protein